MPEPFPRLLPGHRILSRRSCCGGLAAAALAGCGRRGTLAEAPPGAGTDSIRVIVATSRSAVAAPMFFSAERSFATNFAEFTVSIPRERKVGTVAYPGSTPDPRKHFLVTGAERLEGPARFVAAVDAAAASAGGDRTGQLIVHGFNTNFAEGLMKTAQLDHDLQAPGVHMMFSWPSEAHLMAYVADRENALFSRESLAETLRLVRRTTLRNYNLVAHSMGTFLAMETLRQMALSGERATLDRIGAVILISADLDVDVFRRQAEPVLAAGVPIYLLVSRDDRALKLSSGVRGGQKRAGSVQSPADLAGLDVSVVDLSAVGSGDMTRHLKVGTSPELIAFIQRIRASGVAIFEDGQKVGLLDMGAAVVQNTAGIALQPLAP